MIKVLIIVAVILIVIFVLKYLKSGNKLIPKIKRPADNTKPSVYVENDKVIIIKNVNHEDISKAIKSFCNEYNSESYTAMLRLIPLGVNNYAVTFPYDIDFATFCFAVNYLEYPIDITNWKADVKAWATTKSNDEWITEKSANKKVMLYMSAFDKEYDNVFLTTQDNIGYKLGFAVGEETQLLNIPEKHYEYPAIEIHEVSKLKFEDFD